jgi:hypothetical protein
VRTIDGSGNVTCEADDNSGGTVMTVTASAPLVSTGGAAPAISLPDVIITADTTALGHQSLAANTAGTFNTAAGAGALRMNTEGSRNTAFGRSALLRSTTASTNTAVGFEALRDDTTGSDNTAVGSDALMNNETGGDNTAIGAEAMELSVSGGDNTAIGSRALRSNTSGTGNTAVGSGANVSAGDLANATAIGAGAVVDASNKVRIGNGQVTVIEGQVGFTSTSDRRQKEHFRPVDVEMVLGRIRGLSRTSWNFIGQDPTRFRHYGPMAQEFFQALGHDGVGAVGTPTTITSTDIAGILMLAAQGLEERTAELRRENQELKARIEILERRYESLAGAGSR